MTDDDQSPLRPGDLDGDFLYTLRLCQPSWLEADEETLDRVIFEGFYTSVPVFFNDTTLDRLQRAGQLNPEVISSCRQIYAHVDQIWNQPEKWDLSFIKTDPTWQQTFALSLKVFQLLALHHSEPHRP